MFGFAKLITIYMEVFFCIIERWEYLRTLVLKNDAQRTSQRVKWTSGARSLDRSLDRSLSRSLPRSIARPLARSRVRSIAHSIGSSLDRSFP